MTNRIVRACWSILLLLLMLSQIMTQSVLAQSSEQSATPGLIPLVPAARAIDEPFSLQILYNSSGVLQAGESLEIRVELRSVVRDEAVSLIAHPVPTNPNRYEVEIRDLPSEGAYDVEVSVVTETGVLATTSQAQFFAVYHVPRLANLAVSQPLLSSEPITVTIGIDNATRLPVDVRPTLTVLQSDKDEAGALHSEAIEVSKTASGNFVAVIAELGSGDYQIQAALPALQTTDGVLLAVQSLNLPDSIGVQGTGAMQMASWIFSVHLLATLIFLGGLIYQWQQKNEMAGQLLDVSEENDNDVKILQRDLKKLEAENVALQKGLENLRNQQKEQQQVQRKLERLLSRRDPQRSEDRKGAVSWGWLIEQMQQLAHALATRVTLTESGELPSIEELIEALQAQLEAEYEVKVLQVQQRLNTAQEQLTLIQQHNKKLDQKLQELQNENTNLQELVNSYTQEKAEIDRLLQQREVEQPVLRQIHVGESRSKSLVDALVTALTELSELNDARLVLANRQSEIAEAAKRENELARHVEMLLKQIEHLQNTVATFQHEKEALISLASTEMVENLNVLEQLPVLQVSQKWVDYSVQRAQKQIEADLQKRVLGPLLQLKQKVEKKDIVGS